MYKAGIDTGNREHRQVLLVALAGDPTIMAARNGSYDGLPHS
jgi:hypothetical protein